MSGPPDPWSAPAPGEGAAWRRRLWPIVQRTLFRFSPHGWYGFRRALLRGFGARIDPTVRVRRTARLHHPWNVTMAHKSSLADLCVVWARAPVRVGARSVISQYTLVSTCAARVGDAVTVETAPVRIGDDVWVAAECYVAAGSEIADGAIVAARSVVRGRLDPWTIFAGIPAAPRRPRPYRAA